ncbi:uncharacterized protein LOC122502236 [Leptopilina heterotoma]|uniref:uncharacterized protein LOC122502236 n=1 Tax=Leptopilina heterotoma TaxID=63436 RepID=UPI001CAA3CA0|nr:uncharacterized protein LOC122502236 [Leptopilina heterotoma]
MELTKLTRKRGAAKARVTTFRNFVMSIKETLDANNPLTEHKCVELQQRLDKISDVLSDFDNHQTEIELIVEEDSLPGQYRERAEFEDLFYKTTALAQCILDHMRKPEVKIESDDGSASVHNSQGNQINATNRVKLPVLTLPKFDGSYDQWLVFYDTFKSEIHSNDSISAVQKFRYLSSLLTGDAVQVIKGLEISAANYQEAWELLEKRYKNKPLMIHNHIKGIVDYPRIAKQSFSALRDLLNSIQSNLRALKALEQSTDDWNSLLIYLITDKFDSKTKTEWEKQQIEEKEIPGVSNLIDFIEKQCQLLEKTDRSIKETYDQPRSKPFNKQPQNKNNFVANTATNQAANCPMCNDTHSIFQCKNFLDLPIYTRIKEIKRLKRCLNCLRPNHLSLNCKAQFCRKCQKPHNTLLHIEKSSEGHQHSGSSNTATQDVKNETVSGYAGSYLNNSGLLATAVINVFDSNGKAHDCVALLDPGSQSNFISERMCKILNLNFSSTNVNISGVNESQSSISKQTNATIMSKHNKFTANLSFFVAKNVTSKLPTELIETSKLHIPKDIFLADPEFYKPKTVDMLIGVELFWELLCYENTGYDYLHKTKFGYVVSGRLPCIKRPKETVCNLSINLPDVYQQMEKFWNLEECPKIKTLSSEEEICEKIFSDTTKRNKEDFINEYEQLGHMSKVKDKEPPRYSFYLPHHGVLKEDSLTTKLRAVFDGSMPSSTGVSINDLHMVGPTVQPDLLSIIIRSRIHSFFVGADISMMYRRVLIEDEQRSLQRILWRTNTQDPIQTYELNTVTYGLTSSSFLAIRCLMQLAKECEISHPEVSKIIRESMYVDDLLYSVDSIEGAIKNCNDLSRILASAGFPLRKWFSNEKLIIEGLEFANQKLPCHTIDLGENDTIKTLGLSWFSSSDEFMYKINVSLDSETCTKRTILSAIARIYDPLGLLGPCIILAKIIMQKLWRDKSSWDEALPLALALKWNEFISDLSSLETLRIPRHVGCSSPVTLEIHSFSDASEKAYGAAVYVRSTDEFGIVHSKLLCAKSKVAPIKTITIPRLKLCAAQMLAKLVNKAKESFDVNITGTYYWCDSTIVLSWLKLEPCTLKTFVSNRVADIQNLTCITDWHHVSSQDNPADMLSRGMKLVDLKNSSLWWHGPTWMLENDLKFSNMEESSIKLPEIKSKTQVATNVLMKMPIIQFERYSDLMKLKRIMSYIYRFINNCKETKTMRKTGSLSVEETNKAENSLVKIAQNQCFFKEIQCLKQKRDIPKGFKVLKLNPFLHSDGFLRVGGRLDNSDYEFDKKHPKILSSKHPLTRLIFLHEHKRLLHVGPQALLYNIREKYWPISGRNLSKNIVHDCVTCTRANPKPATQLMGNLPSDRVTPSSAFCITGVDYAGPFLIKDRKGRGSKTSKCYVALFVCFASRAIHLELVSDLTSDNFILALRRFASRWGLPEKIRSDNGTNFIGAHSELKELGNFLRKNETELTERLLNESFNWKFIPAYSPHFGGIWEAGIKSTKLHLKRVMGTYLLTFEEFYSLLAQISAILNSRPLSPLSCSPLDLQPLTPGHLLIGRPLTSVPDPDVTHLPESHLSRYQGIQRMQQNFWSRWSKEYVSELQQRTKWKERKNSIQKDSLVLIKDDNSPPMKWLLGRVVELHPGTDGLIRVVSLRTHKGIVKRAITRLCVLPVDNQS